MVNAQFAYTKKYMQVLGHSMAYVEVGTGDPIVFLHGNPASSYLWRNILPFVEKMGRCIVPDLMGMGDSQKLPESGPTSYHLFEHRRHLDALLEALDVRERVVLVVHDWGSALGFDWAMRHPDAIKGIAYMQPIIEERTWDSWPEPVRKLFQTLRTSEGERLVLEENIFIETMFPRSFGQRPSEEIMDNYRRPFIEPGEGRRPMLSWSRQLPVEGSPAEIAELVSGYRKWLTESPLPKLYIESIPGTATESARTFCRSLPTQSTVVVKSGHYPQEEVPDEIGVALATWLQTLA